MGVEKQWTGQDWAAVIGAAVALLTACGAGLVWLVRFLSRLTDMKPHELGWQRAAELEEEARLLRIALHKATQRGNTCLTVSEILLLAMSLPLEERIKAVKQAREIAEGSLSGGGQ